MAPLLGHRWHDTVSWFGDRLGSPAVQHGIGLGVALGLIIVILRRQAAALTVATRRADATRASLAQSELRFRDFVANTRACKLYDFEAGRWLRYREATQKSLAAA